jgi:hypothetical protein
MTGGKRKKTQRKNVSYLLADVKHPVKKKRSIRSDKTSRFELTGVSAGRKRTGSIRFAGMMLILVLASCGIAAWGVKDDALGSMMSAYKNFQSAAEHAKNYDTSAMGRSLSKAEDNLDEIEGYTGILKIVPILKQIPGFISSLRDFNKSAMDIASSTDTLKNSGLSLIWDDGDRLMEEMSNVRSKIEAMMGSFTEVRNRMASLGLASGMSSEYLSLQSKLSESLDLTDGMIDLFRGETNIAILFTNDSEMRATGGFIGSYAVLKIAGGEIEDISVNDIYYPDKFLDAKTIPPSPLLSLTADWEARDANWFFDFPTSASKILGFFEKSTIYADKGITFDGAIAMNHKVVTDILKITGPIELPGYGVVLDSGNFLEEVQKEVSRDSTLRGGERKNILKSLLPELISRMKSMSSTDKEELLRSVQQRLNNKDIQVYIEDRRIQSFTAKSSWLGQVYDIPDSEYGDYLAVVVSNIGGEKTDAYVRQRIDLRSQIGIAGTITDTLSITRVHEGDNATSAFYRANNQTYIRTLVPSKAKFISVVGDTKKTIKPLKNYEDEGYVTDADVEAFESGFESGKAVFGHWLTVPAGDEKKMTIQYERPAAFSDKFRFVYEKQSGTDTMLTYFLQAPPGYVFKETGSSIFEYEGINPPARLIIDLNLEKL